MKLTEHKDEILVEAGSDAIWALLEDSRAMLRWAPMIVATTGGIQRAGSERTCTVEWKGERDEVSERCTEADPPHRIAWVQTRGGMTKMFVDFRFGFSLEPEKGGRTRFRMEHAYRPRHLLAWLLERFMLRRMLSGLRKQILAKIKELTEAAQPRTSKPAASQPS